MKCTPHSADDSEKKKDGRWQMSEFAYTFTIAQHAVEMSVRPTLGTFIVGCQIFRSFGGALA